MSTHNANLRSQLIINKLRKHPASLKEIIADFAHQEKLSGHKLIISRKTFKRDLDQIFSQQGIFIDFSKKVYFIKEDRQPEVNRRMSEFFELSNALDLNSSLSKYVYFEKRKPVGIEALHELLDAIKASRIIKFTYEYYWKNNLEICKVEPYALKEFSNRWYLLANDLADNTIKRFALDRLTALEITKKSFNRKTHIDIAAIYDNCFGIIPPNEPEPSEIILSFDEYQGKYIRSLPLHASQEVINNDEDELRIKLKLHITHDFVMELLSFGETVTVIEPEKLRLEIKRTLQKALENYL